MKLLLVLLALGASAKETKAPTCEVRSKELHHALKVAGDMMATPQENWRSEDIDFIYDTLDKYERAPLIEDKD